MIFVSDFETTTQEDDCRVWAWCSCEVSEDGRGVVYGNDIVTFMEWLEKARGIVYFHNAKFDTDFIMNYLFRNGYRHVADKEDLTDKTFTTLISDDGKFYEMTICFKTGRVAKIRDSLKLMNMSVSQIAKTFNLEEEKLSINYTDKREKHHELTEEEKAYIKNDVVIVAKALYKMFASGADRLTIGSCALNNYIQMRGGKKLFRREFTELPTDVDNFCRKAYRGGYTFLNPDYKGKEVGKGKVYDVNSLYPWSMHSPNVLPYGKPIYYKGRYQNDKRYPLYIQRLSCEFELKDGYLPTLQLKNNSAFVQTEYVHKSKGEPVTLTLTSIDLEIMLDHYHVYNIEYIDGFKFKGKAGLFDGYIDHWMNEKIEAGKEGNSGRRAIAKLYLNSLYGKFATRPTVRSAIPYLNDSGRIAYYKTEYKERETVYSPVGVFVTAIARNKTIRSAQAIKDRFIYADTDSLHIEGENEPEILEVDDYRLGAWKLESEFKRGKYIRAKTYIEEEEKGLKVTCAGLPKKCHDQVTWENFEEGVVYEGKLTPKRVEGGTILRETTFEIKVLTA